MPCRCCPAQHTPEHAETPRATRPHSQTPSSSPQTPDSRPPSRPVIPCHTGKRIHAQSGPAHRNKLCVRLGRAHRLQCGFKQRVGRIRAVRVAAPLQRRESRVLILRGWGRENRPPFTRRSSRKLLHLPRIVKWIEVNIAHKQRANAVPWGLIGVSRNRLRGLVSLGRRRCSHSTNRNQRWKYESKQSAHAVYPHRASILSDAEQPPAIAPVRRSPSAQPESPIRNSAHSGQQRKKAS